MEPKSYYDFDLCTVDTSKTDIRKEAEWLRMIANAKVETDYNARSNKLCEGCPEREKIKRAINSIYGLQAPALINRLEIEKVIFNNPATIVFWSDGTKTVVKCANEEFDKEKGLAMAICKRVLGNKGNYFNEFRKWIKDEEEE